MMKAQKETFVYDVKQRRTSVAAGLYFAYVCS